MTRTCAICEKDRDDVSVVQVLPATWNGFNNFSNVCVPCQGSRQFQIWTRSITRTPRKPAGAAVAKSAVPAKAVVTEAAAAVPVIRSTEITHRRTGALLHTVASASLAQSQLSGVALVGANLQHASMRGADLHNADLRMADLAGADLRGADLRGVNFRAADLRGADLREARMTRAELSDSIYDQWTQWPAGFDPRPCGAHKERRNG